MENIPLEMLEGEINKTILQLEVQLLQVEFLVIRKVEELHQLVRQTIASSIPVILLPLHLCFIIVPMPLMSPQICSTLSLKVDNSLTNNVLKTTLIVLIWSLILPLITLQTSTLQSISGLVLKTNLLKSKRAIVVLRKQIVILNFKKD